MGRRLGLLLILKESVMEHLIVNVDLAHLWLHAFSHLLLKCLGFIGLRCFLSQLANSCLLDEVRKLEWDLVNASLVLEIATLLGPMAGNWNGVADLLAFKKE